MTVNTNKFCNLSTSHEWQSWLYNYNLDVYNDFMLKLYESRGCNQNRNLMKEVLLKIDGLGGLIKMCDFLLRKFPHFLNYDDEIFPDYNEKLLTFPHRKILVDGNIDLICADFISDKRFCDYVIISNVAYVEYLSDNDTISHDDVPSSNWLIKAWRVRNKL